MNDLVEDISQIREQLKSDKVTVREKGVKAVNGLIGKDQRYVLEHSREWSELIKVACEYELVELKAAEKKKKPPNVATATFLKVCIESCVTFF